MNRFRFHPISLLIFFLSLAVNSSAQTSNADPPNIIWIVAEDISPELGCYGNTMVHTPNIDKLATRGLRYDRAFATAPICAPSRSCLISGLYATSLGTQHLRCEIPFPDILQSLPEHLSQAGYFTSNRNKTDYNFSPDGMWEEHSGSYAPWRSYQDDRPFFSFINVGPSHEGSANKENQYLQGVSDIPLAERTNPATVKVPPYYPDTEKTREVWARYPDLLRAMDKNVGNIIDSLEDDNLLNETIIFFFGDHGFGMPRYKRWLYNTGLRVPLIISAPEKYQHMIPDFAKGATDRLVSFVDYAPSVLNLAGVDIPESMEGSPFLGENAGPPRPYAFGARDRADDMFEMSRAVTDGRYIYIRNFMPHLPYIQDGYIYSDVKDAFLALREAKEQGILNTEQKKLWNPKPPEELYDLQTDPNETHNLALDQDHDDIRKKMQQQLFDWMVRYKDLGLLPEAEYMGRSKGTTPYEYARSNAYDVKSILEAARMVGKAHLSTIANQLTHEDSGVRYWSVIALMNNSTSDTRKRHLLEPMLNDPSPSVQIQVAETLCQMREDENALATLGKWVEDDRPWLALQAARSILLIGENARPIIPIMYKVLEENLGDGSKHRKYKNYNYSAFTSWSLEWALQELGEDIEIN